MSLPDFITQHQPKPFLFENQYQKHTTVEFFPVQANSSTTQVDDKTTGGKRSITWFQLLASFKSFYSSVSETGEIIDDDNATLKTYIVKFSPQSCKGVTASRFKDFFNTHFVGKKSLNLIVASETQKSEFKDGKRSLVPNTFEAIVDPSFNLSEFMDLIENKSKK